jgi:hypothetical protein
MSREVEINPPIFVSEKGGVTFALSSIGQVIDFVQRNQPEENWR